MPTPKTTRSGRWNGMHHGRCRGFGGAAPWAAVLPQLQMQRQRRYQKRQQSCQGSQTNSCCAGCSWSGPQSSLARRQANSYPQDGLAQGPAPAPMRKASHASGSLQRRQRPTNRRLTRPYHGETCSHDMAEASGRRWSQGRAGSAATTSPHVRPAGAWSWPSKRVCW